MSTLDLIRTQNEHKANSFFEKGEDAPKLTMKEAFHRAETELNDDPSKPLPWISSIRKETKQCSHI